MKLDSYQGHLLIDKDGKDGVVVLTLPGGKQLRFEEKAGEIHIRELSDGAADEVLVLTATDGSISPVASTKSIRECVAGLLSDASRGKFSDAHRRLLEIAEREIFSQAIELAQGNQAKAARWLGVSRVTMREKLIEFGMRPGHSDL